MIYIVGVGPGNLDFLTEKSIRIIRQAHILVGGKRNLELVDSLRVNEVNKIVYDSKFDLESFLKCINSNDNVVFLASGDPMLYGIFLTISKYVDKNNICVIPGISAVQYLCAKLKISMERLITLSAHGGFINEEFLREIVFALEKYKKVAIFTDPSNTPKYIISNLMKNQEFYNLAYENKDIFRLYIGENLSYENERISVFCFEDIKHLPEDFAVLNTMLITIGGM